MLEAVKYGLVDRGGSGTLFRKLSGLPAPRVLIIGGGHAGVNAAEIALGLGLRVTIVENYWKRIAEPVSYTHLDVYKRQIISTARYFKETTHR